MGSAGLTTLGTFSVLAVPTPTLVGVVLLTALLQPDTSDNKAQVKRNIKKVLFMVKFILAQTFLLRP
jgi:hypothetical protein